MTLSATGLLALIALLGIACQWIAWRLKLPAILFLLLTGILLGPVTGVLNPDLLLGDLLFPLVSLSIAIILFEGALTLHFEELRDVGTVVRRLVSVGALVTWGLIGIAAHYIIGLTPQMATLFGALVVVTGPTVVVPMLRTLRANRRIANVLRWEGIVIDPIGALLAVLVYEYIISAAGGGGQFAATALLFGEVVLVGLVLGSAAAWLLIQVIRRYWLPEYLHAFGALALVLTSFAVSNHLAHESGLLTVTVMGIWLANARDIHVEEILSFKENLTLLLISGLFILLAARMDLSALFGLGLPALALLAVIQFLVRPAAVLVSAVGSGLDWRERALICWVAPRGIVAAAVSAHFALRLEEFGYADAYLLTSLTFAVIIGTVLFQSATAGLVARSLGVTEPESRGLVIIGANRVARTLALALQKLEIPTLLIDASWENTREARMQGLATLHGNPLSSRVEEKLDLAGYGQLLAATPQREFNALCCLHFRSDFRSRFLFKLNTDKPASGRRDDFMGGAGHTLGADAFSYKKFSSLLSQGATIKTTRLSEDFGFGQWQEQNAGSRSLLMAVTPEGRLCMFAPDVSPEPKAGWTLLAIDTPVQPEESSPDEGAIESCGTP